MLCAIYKSAKKEGAYLYLAGRDRFEPVPAALKALLGRLSLVMVMDLNKKKLAGIEIEKLKKELINPGFFLQLPPPPEDNLAIHKDNQIKRRAKQYIKSENS